MLLSTDIWVAALIRRAELGGAFAMVARKGDARAGAVLVKVVNRARRRRPGSMPRRCAATASGCGCSPQPAPRSPSSTPMSSAPPRIDPDLWVVEIEDREGRHFLTEPVENTVNRVPQPDRKRARGIGASRPTGVSAPCCS